MSGYEIINADNREALPRMAAGSVHCVVTSPPYWGQRDYGTGTWEGGDADCDHKGPPQQSKKSTLVGNGHGAGKQLSPALQAQTQPQGRVCGKCGARRIDQQVGMEPSAQEYVDEMVAIFREVRRVLRDDGTLYLNLGDKYGKGKQLLGIPWRVALALQDDGWVLRSDIIWSKPNSMPNSQKDRPTTAHEYIFLLAKSERYFYDDEATKTKSVTRPHKPLNRKITNASSDLHKRRDHDRMEVVWAADGLTKLRSVWTVPVGSSKDAHFAAYPPRLILPCILAGTSEKGCCAACGAPWRRVVERERVATRPGNDTKVTGDGAAEGNRDPERHVTSVRTVGWEQTCNCPAAPPMPCTVLDPFAGTFTTVATAIRRGRRGIGIEMNPEYCEMGRRRITKADKNKGFCLK